VPGQGKIGVDEWQDLEWEFQTNLTVVRVNGQERARFSGRYAGLTDVVGFKTIDAATIGVRRFEVLREEPVKGLPPIDLKSGLVLYFPFDTDEKDRATDFSGFGNHGKVQGATFVPAGRVGGALLFRGGSGKGDRIAVPHSASLITMQRTRQLTICAWLRPNSLPAEVVLTGKGGDWRPGGFGGYELVLTSKGDQQDLWFVSGGCRVHTPGRAGRWLTPDFGHWLHVAVVADARFGRVKFYVNGERAADEAYDGQDWSGANFAVANPLFIGGPDPTQRWSRTWFDGLIDEVRVYTRALSGEEIRALPGFVR